MSPCAGSRLQDSGLSKLRPYSFAQVDCLPARMRAGGCRARACSPPQDVDRFGIVSCRLFRPEQAQALQLTHSMPAAQDVPMRRKSASRLQANACLPMRTSAATCSVKRIMDCHRSDCSSVVHILGNEPLAAGLDRRGDDQRIIPRVTGFFLYQQGMIETRC